MILSWTPSIVTARHCMFKKLIWRRKQFLGIVNYCVVTMQKRPINISDTSYIKPLPKIYMTYCMYCTYCIQLYLTSVLKTVSTQTGKEICARACACTNTHTHTHTHTHTARLDNWCPAVICKVIPWSHNRFQNTALCQNSKIHSAITHTHNL